MATMSAPTTIHSSVSTPRSSLTYDQTVLNTLSPPPVGFGVRRRRRPEALPSGRLRRGRSLRAGQPRDLPADRVDGGGELGLERALIHCDAYGHEECAHDDPLERLHTALILKITDQSLHLLLLLFSCSLLVSGSLSSAVPQLPTGFPAYRHLPPGHPPLTPSGAHQGPRTLEHQ